MTPEEMAALMAENHPDGLGWSAKGIATMLAAPSVSAIHRPEGFALVRRTGPEAEILTVEVRPGAQGRGVGTSILSEAIAQARAASVTELHLEVARDNAPARRLYARAGFAEVGVRPGYYRDGDGAPVDALLMRLRLAPSGTIAASPLGSART
jgi:ribosomal-protein-alanine N-acetyltransferase